MSKEKSKTTEELERLAANKITADSIDRKYGYWRTRVMYSMMVGYAIFYFVRKNISMAAKSITDEFGMSNTEWGFILSAGTIIYAFSKFLSGILADRVNPKYMMGFGLLASAGMNIGFGSSSTFTWFLVFWSFNSLFQGMGMPPCSHLLTSWFSPREIGRAWGVWNSSHQIGGAIIVALSGYLILNYGWRSAFFVPAAIAVLIGLWLLNRLTDSPESQGLPPIEVYKGEEEEAIPPEQMGALETFKKHILWNPWVWLVSVANFFVYIVRIGILDWAPKYLEEAKGFNISDAGIALSAYELAGIFGAFVAGWLSDGPFQGRRGPVSVYFMLMLVASVIILLFVPSGQVLNMSLVFISIGFFVYGPQMLIAVAAADYATKLASASAVGLTGLLGYLGATVCGLITGILVDRFGWDSALYFYLASAVLGSLLLALTWKKTAKDFRN